MKPTLQRKESIAHAGRLVAGTSKVKKGTNRQKKSAQKASASTETRKEVAKLELKSGKVVDPSTKIKLQLFPVDEATRIALEKDGLNPFLELTLRARKKISSVINHIHTKWGTSIIASIGEPMLLPYESQHTSMVMSNRWTSKDTTITAGDVFTAVNSPPVFRLSYGWFSNDEPPHNSGSMHKDIETTEERKLLDHTDLVDTKVKIGQSHEGSTPSLWDNDLTNLSIGGLLSELSGREKTYLSTDISIGGLLSEASLQGKLNNNNQHFKWDDNTALSIGGLLSEVSMQAKMNPNSSLDASIKNEPQVSILDAEETCNAFSFRKLSSSSKNVRVTAKATQLSTSSSFKFPGLLQGDREVVHAEDISGPEPKTKLFQNEDSRSLGIRGINWNESLGPFDLGNSRPWKI